LNTYYSASGLIGLSYFTNELVLKSNYGKNPFLSTKNNSSSTYIANLDFYSYGNINVVPYKSVIVWFVIVNLSFSYIIVIRLIG